MEWVMEQVDLVLIQMEHQLQVNIMQKLQLGQKL